MAGGCQEKPLAGGDLGVGGDLLAHRPGAVEGEAGERQLKRNTLGLAQNLGGSGATSVITILGAA